MNDAATSERGIFKPFTLVVSVPAAWPWDQMRAARLEAQHTSPVAGDDVSIVVRRLKSWALNEPGKFAVIYLRGGETHQGVKFELDIQGQRLVIDMPSPQQKAELAQQRLWRLILTACIVLSLLLTASLSFKRRAAEAEQIAQLEVRLDRGAKVAEGVERAKADAVALADLGLNHRRMDDALADLRTLSLQRDTTVRLEAFYWDKGYWAVEAHGTTPPIKDATIAMRRSTKPVRKDVWLWVSASEDGQP